MIYDRIDNIFLYKDVIPAEIIADIHDQLFEPQTLEGYQKNHITFRLASDKDFEMHRKHIDLHVMIQGVEQFAMTFTDRLEELGPFHQERDIGFGKGNNKDYINGQLKEGGIYIIFPT
ncbi:YhcH/YjgK/YiaL family protein [Virgibacillus halophilus]|uniref:YhcH/YjgK/YiaL family protein n=1 Tax=Tigheibacillus halophilus TaxID=361280 RepID=A0ABU5C4R3_9BACI|nr:YhcH/YjgK/YiaL family protein [Virgibacillus halophilus]